MTDDGDLRAVVLGAIAMLESERDAALARAEAAEACAKESAEIMYRQRDRLEAERDEALARAMEAERLLSEYRRENGCTRGQRTTQWCGEAARLRGALKEIWRKRPRSVFQSEADLWNEIDRVHAIAEDTLKGDG
jgi:hypothetical protein